MGYLVGKLETGDIIIINSQKSKKKYLFYKNMEELEIPMFIINIYNSPFVIRSSGNKTELLPVSLIGNEVKSVIRNFAMSDKEAKEILGKILVNLHATSTIENSIYQQLFNSTEEFINERLILTILKMIGLNIELTYNDIDKDFSMLSLVSCGAGFHLANVLVDNGDKKP